MALNNISEPTNATMALLNQWTSEPTAPETIRLILGRKMFNGFLHTIHDKPDDSWKAAQIELKGRDVPGSKFDRIEFFTDTLIGPVVGMREAATEDVYITVQRQRVGKHRTAEAIISAIGNGEVL